MIGLSLAFEKARWYGGSNPTTVGLFALPNENGSDLYVFWSDEAYARQHSKEDWVSYKPTPIELSAFLERWVPGMHKDGFLVGVQFNSDLAGLEVTPLELARDLGHEL